MNFEFAYSGWLWLLVGLLPLLVGLIIWVRRWRRVDAGSLLIWRRAAQKAPVFPRRFPLDLFVLFVLLAGVLPVIALTAPFWTRAGGGVTIVVDTSPSSGFARMTDDFARAVAALRADNPSVEMRIYSPADARSLPVTSTQSALPNSPDFSPSDLLSALLAAEPEMRFVWLSTRRPGITSPRLFEYPLVRAPSGGRLLAVWNEGGRLHAAVHNDTAQDADFSLIHAGITIGGGRLPAGRSGVIASTGAASFAPGMEYVLVRSVAGQEKEDDRLLVPQAPQCYLAAPIMARYPELALALRAAGAEITGDSAAAEWIFTGEQAALKPGQHAVYVAPGESRGGVFYSGAELVAGYALITASFAQELPALAARGIAGGALREAYLPVGARSIIEVGSGATVSPFLAELPPADGEGRVFFLVDIPRAWARGPGLAICAEWLLRQGRYPGGRGAMRSDYYTGEPLADGKLRLADASEAVRRVSAGWLAAALAGVVFVALCVLELRKVRVL